MSGSRTAARELVYCHACQNEFYKHQDGLTCPECQSDFTEVVEPDFEPPSPVEPGPFHYRPSHPQSSHADYARQWRDFADDPDEDDIDLYSRTPGSSYRDRRARNASGQEGYMTSDPFSAGSPFAHPLFDMVQNITGQRAGPPGPHPAHQHAPQMPGSWTRPRSPPGMAGHPNERNHFSQTYGPNGSVHISFSSNTGGGWTTTTNHGPRGDVGSFGDILQSLLNGAAGPAPRAGGGVQPPNPLGMLFQMLNPAMAQHGDAVFTQEALDRVITSLMDQHTSGTAPGPASEAAIARLPRRKVTDEMLDENTKQAECSICMENVTVGEEVTFLPCNHWFHHPCVEAWLKEHDTCPVCRTGIMPKEGSSNAPRHPNQAPLHNQDPAHVARRQSGTREHPYVVPESPTASRRRPNPRRHSSSASAHAGSSSQPSTGDMTSGGGGITSRVRSFFSGGGTSNSDTSNQGSTR